jgi:hypothetical protein
VNTLIKFPFPPTAANVLTFEELLGSQEEICSMEVFIKHA